MKYFLSKSSYFDKQISRIRDNNLANKILRIMQKLETEPRMQKKVCTLSDKTKVFEERKDLGRGMGLRVYYSVQSFIINLEMIEFEKKHKGFVRIYRFGNKKSQRQDIGSIKLEKDLFLNENEIR
ncbi:MAG: hypothetical protein U9M89_01320 [Patescibacteria group bacterium]|nr:hypothetical protein [Patescibacteria group bacterium]